MLTPLFSPDCELVGWMQAQKFLFDAEMGYVAFLAGGHAWSARSGQWIGPVVGPHVFDIEGRPVAWNPAAALRGAGRPLRPVNVVRAISPVRPARPISPVAPLTAPMPAGGWSPLPFAEWLVANDPRPALVMAVTDAVDEAVSLATAQIAPATATDDKIGAGDGPNDVVK